MVKSATNVLAESALQSITTIKERAKQEMELQAEKLKEARAAIRQRIEELEAQEAELDQVIGGISGRPAAAPRAPRAARATPAETADLRRRMMAWLTAHKGEKCTGAELKKNFPELGARSPSVVLAPEIEAGHIKREGQRSTMTYAV
jgi:hypothetical protein